MPICTSRVVQEGFRVASPGPFKPGYPEIQKKLGIPMGSPSPKLRSGGGD